MVDQETDSNHETFTDRVQQARAHYEQQAGLGKSLASPRIRLGLALYRGGPASMSL